MKSILFVASEGLPFVKGEGVAAFIGALPKTLAKLGHDVRVVLPLVKSIEESYRNNFEEIGSFEVTYGYFNASATLYTKKVDGVTYYFIDKPSYFDRDQVYGYDDDAERFAFYQVAVLEMLGYLDYFPDIMHSNDWSCGYIPVLAKESFYIDERYNKIKQVFTIHDLAKQGNFNHAVLESLFGLSQELYNNGKLRFRDGISFMKGAILYADQLTTISKTHAEDILTPAHGESLENILNTRRRDLVGIVNGIDVEYWNPKNDTYLPVSLSEAKGVRSKIKMKLQERVGLRVNKETALVGMVSRLDWDKGLPILIDALPNLVAQDLQFVFLGKGDTNYEKMLQDAAKKCKRRVAYIPEFDEELAHMIFGGSDIYLMPSLFEPCGSSQLKAMHYGAVPVVRATGGLKDSVQPFDELTKEGVGFTFDEYSGEALLAALSHALDFYYDKNQDFEIASHNARKEDVSWEKTAKEYHTIYKNL